jgi:osmoprotectant transport system ATP-binding protein
MPDATICVENLSKAYPSGDAVKGVSFQVSRGEILSLVGRSGAGKTTTLKMLNRLIEPTAGRVLIEGEDNRALSGEALRRKIGYVFQKVGLFPRMTVGENVGISLKLLGLPKDQVSRRVDELLDMVELERSVRSRMPESLSGGEQQRVGLARALAAKPRIMLLDEPFGALDPLTRERLQRMFLRLHRELELTAVLVTHDLVEAVMLSARVAVMRDKQLVQLDKPANLIRAPNDSYVRELFEIPRRQARLFEAFSEGCGDV